MPKDSNVLPLLSVSRVLRQKGPLIRPSKKLPGKRWVRTQKRNAKDSGGQQPEVRSSPKALSGKTSGSERVRSGHQTCAGRCGQSECIEVVRGLW